MLHGASTGHGLKESREGVQSKYPTERSHRVALSFLCPSRWLEPGHLATLNWHCHLCGRKEPPEELTGVSISLPDVLGQRMCVEAEPRSSSSAVLPGAPFPEPSMARPSGFLQVAPEDQALLCWRRKLTCVDVKRLV